MYRVCIPTRMAVKNQPSTRPTSLAASVRIAATSWLDNRPLEGESRSTPCIHFAARTGPHSEANLLQDARSKAEVAALIRVRVVSPA